MPTTLKVLATFGKNGDGTSPYGDLFADSAGNLFGTAKNGGDNGSGTVFEVPLISGAFGNEGPLVNLTVQTGTRPTGGLIADAAGNLFGTTHSGGANGGGTAFEIVRTAGVYSIDPFILANFSYFGGPVGDLIADSAGNLFGMAEGGGTGPLTIFEIPRTGSTYGDPNRLASFTVTNSTTPTAGLFLDMEGNLIGTRMGGGLTDPYGGVFELKKVGLGYDTVPTQLVNFAGTDGANPNGALIADASGNLFGTTGAGGANALNDGTVYEIARTSTGYADKPTVLVSFDFAHGAAPAGRLLIDVDGNLYGTTTDGGTTTGGGASKAGTVFEVTRNAKVTNGYDALPRTLVSFTGANGATPSAGLIGNSAGNLFGTTSAGGSTGMGTVFEVLGSGFRTSNVVVAPTATSVTISPARGNLPTGTFVTFTVAMSAGVTVSSNAPALTLNDGGTAAYDAAHSTATSLVFDYTVRTSDSTTALVATGLLTHGATITDTIGNAAVFTPALPATFASVEINIPAPSVTAVVASPNKGNQQTGTLVTLTVTMSEPISIVGGVPGLKLNDGGSAVYDAKTSTATSLVFDYTAQATESTTALAVTGFNANGATIQDTLSNNADFTAASVTFTGLAINSVLPAVASMVATPGMGNVTTGKLVTLTATMSEAVIVSDGTPTLTLNDGGSATFDVAKSTDTSLVFDYTVLAAETTTGLAATAFNANGAKIADALGNGAVMTGAVVTFTGLTVNLPASTVQSIAALPATGDVMTGTVVTMTVTMSKAVTVSAGVPTLVLNDNGVASYSVKKSSPTTLAFDYVPQTGQTTTALAVTGLNLNGSMIQDQSGIAADFSGATQTFAGLEINVTTPTAPIISGIVAGQATSDSAALSPFSNVAITDQNANQKETVTITLSSPANGTLSNLGGGTYNATSGLYSITGSPSAVTVALDGVVFTPTPRQAAAGQIITTTFAMNVVNTAGLSTANALTSVVVTEAAQSTTGVLGVLSISQQLELIYIAYFNRAADSGGSSFWSGQNAQAQTGGQSASLAMTNIANSFQPQAETIALYPFLGSTRINFADPSVQVGLTTFITSVYGNLFGHVSDPLGAAYWAGQLSNGVVGLGAAALAIANGATGSDAIELRNKIAVAQDFTTRTTAAGLGVSGAPASLIAQARAVLAGVDGTALNDGSVTAGMNLTAAYITGATTSGTSALAASSASVAVSDVAPTGVISVAVDPNVMTITGSDQLADPSAGTQRMRFLPNPGVEPLATWTGNAGVADVGALLAGARLDPGGDLATSGVDLSAANAVNSFDPLGLGGGSAFAPTWGPGETAFSRPMVGFPEDVRIM